MILDLRLPIAIGFAIFLGSTHFCMSFEFRLISDFRWILFGLNMSVGFSEALVVRHVVECSDVRVQLHLLVVFGE